MTYTFNEGSYSLKEKATIKKELCLRGISPNLCDSISRGKCDCLKYLNYIASLKEYPCIKDKRWVDGKEYSEDEFDIVDNGSAKNTDWKVPMEQYARLKEPVESKLTIKEECEQMYAQIKNAEERLKTLRAECKHLETFEGNYSYRPGAINKATICSDCGAALKINFQ